LSQFRIHPFAAASVATVFRHIHLEQDPESDDPSLWNRSGDGGGVATMMAQTTSEDARDRMILGSKQECIDKIDRFVKAGVAHFIFVRVWAMAVDHEVQAFAEKVIAAFRGKR
jgi:alkanesulfonate monooxygenase SsuD/methylene tetrahydromethanopterin reductase-like flavin-dependent oxidoreductase (luciferase family)